LCPLGGRRIEAPEGRAILMAFAEMIEDGRRPPEINARSGFEPTRTGGTRRRPRIRRWRTGGHPRRLHLFSLNHQSPLKTKTYLLGTILPVVLAIDIISKRWALSELPGRPSELFGGIIPLNLAFNRGAAFGLSVGNDPRWFFIPVTLLALGLLSYLLVRTDAADRLRIFALSLVLTGALGNLIDRLRWVQGVVDFIGPINLGFMDWPIFNVADMAISCGAVALAISFWMEESENAKAKGEVQVEVDPETTA
jgi:signal peptidase II